MSDTNNLTKEQIESIKNYGNEVISLKDFIEGVRTRPTMYIGYIGSEGFLRMFREIYQNCIDEVQRPNSPCNMIHVTFDERTCTVIVEDNGRGIPFGNIIRIYTQQHTSSNYKKKQGEYTAGTNGIGAKATNALSEKFIVESYVLGEGRRVEFDKGYPWEEGERVIPNTDNKQGTIILFKPDYDIMGHIDTKAEDLFRFISTIHPLTNLGTRVIFTAVKADGKSITTELLNSGGLMDVLISICPSPLIKPIVFGQDTGTMRANIFFTYDMAENSVPENIISFANFCPTDSVTSSHTKGFIAGIKRFFINYMNKVYLNSVNSSGSKKQKKDIIITEADIRMGIRAVVNCDHLEPRFTGQAKDCLDMDEIFNFVMTLTINSLEEWSKSNPQSLQKLCKYFKDMASIRASMDAKKVKIQNQYSSSVNGLPSKFIAPTKYNKEFFICEGDSAKGSIENYRHNETQGVFPIRGMIVNCFEKDEKTLLENAEVAGLIAIIGGGYGKNFDINKVEWEKVITATDADNAGHFIASLLLRFVLRFMPDLIRYGRFYRSVPPLYYIKKGKQKIYFSDRIELVKYIQKSFSKNNIITTLNDKKLSGQDVEELLYNNIDYIYELEKVSNLYRISPDILEIYLNNRNKTPKEICKAIKAKYRFMDMVEINGHITCDGIANGVSNTLILDDRMLHECNNIINIMSGNLYDHYKVNGREMSILDIMRLYDSYNPSNLMRLKGLGEQDPEELAESVVYPGDMGNRTLIQYTMDSAMKDIEQIRYFESNKNKLLEDLKVTRLDITD